MVNVPLTIESRDQPLEPLPSPASLGDETWAGLPVGFGTAPLGGLFEAVDDDVAESILQRAWDAGIRYFDTAPLYGHGLAERRLGRLLSGQSRSEFVVSTKVGRLIRDGAPVPPDQVCADGTFYKTDGTANPVFDYSPDGIRRSLEESLERLGLDRVDVALIHDPDDFEDQVVAESLPTMIKLREEGIVRSIGLGMNQFEMPERLIRLFDIDLVLLAGRYTLLDRSAEASFLSACEETKTGVIFGGMLNSGLLANPNQGATFDYLPADSVRLDQARLMQAAAERHDRSLIGAAFLHAARAGTVASALLISARSLRELNENLDHLSKAIPQSLWNELDSIAESESCPS